MTAQYEDPAGRRGLQIAHCRLPIHSSIADCGLLIRLLIEAGVHANDDNKSAAANHPMNPPSTFCNPRC
jgi:hypothetical protein